MLSVRHRSRTQGRAVSSTSHRRRIGWPIGLVVVAVSLAVPSACASNHARHASLSPPASFKLTPVAWPALRRLWIAQIEPDGERTWVSTLLPTGVGQGNLFSLEPRTLAVRQLPVHVRLAQIFAGEGQLWGIPDDGRSLLQISTSTGTVQSRPLRPPCGELANPAGVWAVTPHALIGIAGDASHRSIRLRNAGEPRLWQTQGNQAWALDLKSLNKTLIQVDLAAGTSRRFPLDTHGRQVDGFAVGPKDIWATLTDKPLILRFDHTSPRQPSAQVDLSNAAGTGAFQVSLTAGPSYLWVELFSNRRPKLYRIAATR